MVANIFGPDGLIVLLVIVVLLFGAGQLPKLARSFGEAGKEFKKAQAEAEAEAEALKRSATPAVGDTSATVTPVAGTTAAAATPVVGATAAAATPVVTPDDKVTLSRAELNALLDEREARARGEVPPTA